MIKSPPDMNTKKLILASASPRRNELLGLFGIPFSKRPADIDERKLSFESPWDYVQRMAFEKGSVHPIGKDEIVLSADTIVELDGVVLGKPTDDRDADRILKLLRAKTHRVYTALSLHLGVDREVPGDICESLVTMREYSDDEIRDYISRGDYADKAGGYAIQDPYFRPMAEIQGCYSNVMGLPLCSTFRLLKKAGLSLDADIADFCQRYNHISCTIHPELLRDVNDE